VDTGAGRQHTAAEEFASELGRVTVELVGLVEPAGPAELSGLAGPERSAAVLADMA
jgi:hypothetical protein